MYFSESGRSDRTKVGIVLVHVVQIVPVDETPWQTDAIVRLVVVLQPGRRRSGREWIIKTSSKTSLDYYHCTYHFSVVSFNSRCCCRCTLRALEHRPDVLTVDGLADSDGSLGPVSTALNEDDSGEDMVEAVDEELDEADEGEKDDAVGWWWW